MSEPLLSANQENVKYNVIDSSPPKKAKFTWRLGPLFFRNPKRWTVLQWVFLVMTVLTFLAMLGFTIERIVFFSNETNVRYHNSPNSPFCKNASSQVLLFSCQSDLTLAIVLLVNTGFVVFYAFDGLIREQMFEMLTYIAAVVFIFMYITINYIYQATQGRANDGPKIARFVLIVLLGPVNIVLASLVCYKMGFIEFDALGANPKVLRAYKWTRALSANMKLNFEILLSVLLMIVTRQPPLTTNVAETVILSIWTFAYLVAICLTSASVYKEWRVLMIVYFVIQVLTGVYFVFQLIYTSIIWSQNVNTVSNKTVFDPTAILSIVIIILCLCGIVSSVVTLVLVVRVTFNFGKGIKERLINN